MHKGLIITVIIAAFAAGSAEAIGAGAMAITYALDAPVDRVMEYNAEENRNTDNSGGGPIASEWTAARHRIWGQSFRHDAASFTLDSVTLKLNNAADGTANVEGMTFGMKVFSLDDMNDATANTVLLDATGNMPASMPTGISYVTFDFSDQATMSAGQQYGFTFDFVAEDPANITWFREAWNNNNYTNGLELLSIDGGATWNTVSDSMAFWVVQTPEPTTILFMGCGAAGLLRRRKSKARRGRA